MNKSKFFYMVFGILIGSFLFGGTVYAYSVLNGSEITFDNSSNGMTSTNVQSAIEELNNKINNSEGRYEQSGITGLTTPVSAFTTVFAIEAENVSSFKFSTSHTSPSSGRFYFDVYGTNTFYIPSELTEAQSDMVLLESGDVYDSTTELTVENNNHYKYIYFIKNGTRGGGFDLPQISDVVGENNSIPCVYISGGYGATGEGKVSAILNVDNISSFDFQTENQSPASGTMLFSIYGTNTWVYPNQLSEPTSDMELLYQSGTYNTPITVHVNINKPYKYIYIMKSNPTGSILNSKIYNFQKKK